MTIGMDPAAVRALADQMDASAGQIEDLIGTLTGAIDGAEWIGPDRERFVADWQSNQATHAAAVAVAVRDAGTLARANAEEQETASS